MGNSGILSFTTFRNNREGIIMAQTKELVLAEATTAVQAFSKEGGLDPIIQEAKDFVSDFDHDLSTGAGRKRTASLAAKVAKLKVRLDDMGKDLVSDWKKQSKAVDQSRKAMRESLDELKTEARKPLTDWEDEQERVKAEKLAQLAAERQAAEIEAGHEMALLMNEKVDNDAMAAEVEAERQRQAEIDRLAKEQAEREERLKHEAAEKARIEAEQKAQAERNRIEQGRLDALRREQEAQNRADQAEKDRIASEERAIQQQKKAERDRLEAEERAKQQEQERINAEARAKENARIQAEQAEIRRKESEERARQEEIQRQQDEQARIQREQEQREADRQHVGDIRRQAKEAFMALGMTEEMAIASVLAIHKGAIPAVTISY